MKTYRDSLLAKLHILLQQQGVDDDTKAEMYAGYGVTTAADMTNFQLSHLVGRLEGRAMGGAPVARPYVEAGPETRRLRSQCLKLMTGSPAAVNPRTRGLGIPNDWAIINPFVQHHAGALLNQLSDGALIDFVKKLRKIRDSGWFYRTQQAERPAQPSALYIVAPTGNLVVN